MLLKTFNPIGTILQLFQILSLYVQLGLMSGEFDILSSNHEFLSRVRRADENSASSIKDAVSLIPKNYSIHQPPSNPDGSPIQVEFYVLIVDVRDVNEISEQLTLELNLQMFWKDSRLAHLADKSGSGTNKFVVLNPVLIPNIWHPDVFIDHVKKVEQPKLISTPASLRMYSDDTLRYSARLTIQMSCPMKFHYYPTDTQHCNVDLKSYGYLNKILTLDWRDRKEAAIKRDIDLSSFRVALGNAENFTVKTSSGIYSAIRFTVILRRYLSYHMIQTYLPSTLFVIISWLSFFVSPESIPGRMTLCVTTLLTLTAMFASVRQNTPNVSYVKGLDIWMVTCIIFVFFTLLEYTLLLKFVKMKQQALRRKQKKSEKRRKGLAKKDAITNQNTVIQFGSRSNGNEKDSCDSTPAIINFRRLNSPKTNELQLNEFVKNNGFPASPNQAPVSTTSHQQEKSALYEDISFKIEYYCSRLIPCLFILFNIIYWPTLLSLSDYYDEANFLNTRYAE